MNKVSVSLLFLALSLALVVANFYVLPTGFEEIVYPRYREEGEDYAYNSKNPLMERYKYGAMDVSLEN